MKFSIIITICGFQNGIKNDSTKWFTLEIRKSVVRLCIYIPGVGVALAYTSQNKYKSLYEMHAFNSVTLVSQ